MRGLAEAGALALFIGAVLLIFAPAPAPEPEPGVACPVLTPETRLAAIPRGCPILEAR